MIDIVIRVSLPDTLPNSWVVSTAHTFYEAVFPTLCNTLLEAYDSGIDPEEYGLFMARQVIENG